MDRRKWNRSGFRPRLARAKSRRLSRWGDLRPTNAEAIQIQAWLIERLMLLHHERRSWWARVRQLLGF